MFAVSRKPISNTGKFVIKNDPKEGKQKAEELSPQPAKETGKTESQSSLTSQNTSQKSEVKSLLCDNGENKETKRIKIRLSIIKDVPYGQKTSLQAGETNGEKKMVKKSKEMKTKQKRVNREGNFNCGRWQPEEHQRFIEAIMRYGNEWKSVQRHVGTRSSTQARSHAQKFFVKIKKTNLLDLNMDLSKNSIKTLHEIANTMNSEEYFNAIKKLNCVAFEHKSNTKRKNRKEEETQYEDSEFLSEAPNMFNINDDIFSLNTNDNTLFNSGKNSEIYFIENPAYCRKENLITNNYNNIHNFSNFTTNQPNILHFNNPGQYPNSNYSVKIIQNEKSSDNTRKKNHHKTGVNTIIINNHINNYNYNVSIRNLPSHHEKDRSLNRKRNRLNSHEKNTLINLFPDIRRECAGTYPNHKKSCDESDLMEFFNCSFNQNKNDFDEEKDLLMFSQSRDAIEQFNTDMLLMGHNLSSSMQSDLNFDELMLDVKPDYNYEKKTKTNKKAESDEIKIEPLFFN